MSAICTANRHEQWKAVTMERLSRMPEAERLWCMIKQGWHLTPEEEALALVLECSGDLDPNKLLETWRWPAMTATEQKTS